MFPNDLWIADPHANKLYKVVNDIVQPTVLNTSNNPRSILVSQDMTSVYAVNRDSNSITQYRSGTEIRTIGVGKMPYGICEDSNHNVYVTNYQDNTVTKISGSKVVATIAVDAGPRGITCDENDDIYVACFLSSTVVKISSGVNVASIQVGQNPEGITCDSSDNIWVACYGSNIATKITKGIKVLDIEVGKGPVAIVVDNKGVVYTANYYSNDVTMIATNSDATMSITNIPVGDGPTAIAVNRDNEVYVTSGLGTDVRKIVDGVVTDTIEVCDNPSAFGDFTGCSAYNVFNQVPAGGTTVGVPEGGWKLTDLESGVQDALNKVIGGISPSTASNVTYEKTTMVDDEEEILNITVESALNELYTTTASQNDPKKIIVDKESGTTLETKLSQIDTAVNNCPTDAEFTSLKTIVNNAATQSQLNDVATIANNAATKEQLYQVSSVANAAAKKTELTDAVNRISSIEQTYNKPSAITVASGDDGPVTLDQKLASIDADIATRATTIALNAVKTTADAAAPQTALDAVSTRLTTVEEKYNKPENIVVGSVSTPGASPEDPPTTSNVTLDTKLTEIDGTTSDLDTRLEEVEGSYNKPEKIIVGQKDAEEEESDPVDVTLTDKLKEIDDTLATKADNAGTSETINGINERVQAIEEVYNKPDHIIVEYTGEEQDTPVTLVDKFISVAEQFTTDEEKIEDHETRVATIEAVYNKPEKIIVGQKEAEGGEGEPDPIDVTLADKLTEIDSKFTTQDEEDTAMDGRVKAIEAVYNKPDHIIVGQVPSEEEPETAVDVTLSTKLGEIDTEVEEVKALAEAAATQTDFDELSQEVSENETILTQLKSDYDATKTVVDGLETDMTTVKTNMNQPSKIVVGQTEDDEPADITLDNKLASMDKAITAKAEQTALEEVKETADAAAPQTALDAVDTRVETLETNINNPDLIIVNPDPETNLTTKLADIDSKFSTQEGTNSSVNDRISAIEAVYNKPDHITVEEEKTLDVKLGEIDDALGLKLEAGAISDMLTKTEASSTYATKTAIADMATNASVDGKLAAYTNTEGMNAALALKADKATVESTYATKQELTTATTDMATNAGVDTKLEPYAKTSDVDSKITAAVSGLQWKTSVADITALKAITTPAEGWTVSVNDTNSVYRFDAQSVEEDDGDKFIKADDDTAGAWVKLSTAFYSVATGSADGLMSAADKTKLDGITISDYLKVSEATSTYATQTAIADMATNASVDTKLEGYVPVADISDMLTKTEATSTYATKVELGNKADSSAIADMATNAKVAETYATKESLADYATTEAMNAALGNKADTTALSAYATTESVKSTYATKAELGNKADTSAIADMATNTEVAETYATKDELSGKADTSALAGYVQTSAIADMATNAKVAETYATKTELSAKADSSALANYVQTSAIEDMATNTDVEATYATKAALTEGLAGKADTNALSKYATTESLANYVQTSAIADMATNAGVAGTYATKESLADYATTEAMNAALGNKADTSALANYATTEALKAKADASAISDMLTKTEAASTYAAKAALDAKADSSAIADMATNTEVAETYATKESLAEYATKAELGNKADTSAIANMNNPDNIMISEQTLTATIASLQSTIAELTSRIEALESPQG